MNSEKNNNFMRACCFLITQLCVGQGKVFFFSTRIVKVMKEVLDVKDTWNKSDYENVKNDHNYKFCIIGFKTRMCSGTLITI